MKILYVITGLGQGGAERVVCDLADQMHQRGHSVKIAYLTGDILTRPINSEIELIKVNLNNLITLPTAYFNLQKIIKENNPDIIHSHMVHANILTRLIRLSTPIKKLICTAHNSNEGSFLRMALYRITHNLADLTTNVSNTAVYSFEKKKAVPKNTMRTVYNGINFTRFKYSSVAKQELFNELNLKDNTKIILAVGRLNQQKNYPNLLRAIKLLNDKYTEPFMLLIAGDGELRLYIEKLINELNLNNFVLLLGRRSDIPKLMSACDVFVLSSDYEGLPTVLIEALACQAHTVSTDVSGAAEVLKDNGVIVPINNPEELFKAIEALLKKNYKNSLGFKYAYETFDLQIISEKWLNIYNEN